MQHSSDWERAEEFALDHMRNLGFKDAKMNSGGADGGIDLESAAAAAQVKHLQNRISRPDVQRFHGAAPANKFRLYYSLAGYSREAKLWAEENNIALFVFDLNARVAEPVTSAAIQLDKGLSDPEPPQTVPHVYKPPAQGTSSPYGTGPYSPVVYGQLPPRVQPSPPSLAEAIRASKEPQPLRWYFGVALFTASTFAWIPLLHAYSLTNNLRWRNWGIGFSIWCTLLLSLSAVASSANDGSAGGSQGLNPGQYLISFAAIGGMIVAFLLLIPARQEVLNPAPLPPPLPPQSYFDPPATSPTAAENVSPRSEGEAEAIHPAPLQVFAPSPPPRPAYPRWYRPTVGRIIGSFAWSISPLLTLGFGTPITLGIAAIRRRSLEMIAYAAVYLGLSVWMYAAGGPSATDELAFDFWLFFSWILANVHTFIIRRRVWYLPYDPNGHNSAQRVPERLETDPST